MSTCGRSINTKLGVAEVQLLSVTHPDQEPEADLAAHVASMDDAIDLGVVEDRLGADVAASYFSDGSETTAIEGRKHDCSIPRGVCLRMHSRQVDASSALLPAKVRQRRSCHAVGPKFEPRSRSQEPRSRGASAAGESLVVARARVEQPCRTIVRLDLEGSAERELPEDLVQAAPGGRRRREGFDQAREGTQLGAPPRRHQRLRCSC